MPKLAAVPRTTKQQSLMDATYRMAVEQADVAISITDPQANIVYVNKAFANTTGYSAEELMGRNQSSLSNRTTPESVYAGMWGNLQLGLPWHGRLLNRKKDDSPYIADLIVTPVQGKNGKVEYYLGMHRDVTAMHQLEQRTLNQKHLIETVVDSAPMAIALLNRSRKVILDNLAYKKMVADLGVAEPAHLIIDAMKKATTSASGAVEVRIERGSGRPPRWFSCTLAAVEIRDESADRFFDPGHETAMLLVVSDITRLREEQEKVRATALKAMLAEEEHTATLRESMSATLYQIEEPINVIASAVALMRGRGDFAASGMLESAVEEARRRMDALRELTAAAAPAPEAATAINLNEVVRDVLDILTPRFLASGITLDWQPEAVLPALLGSPLKLRLAVKSIIDNAIDAIEAVVAGKKAGKAKGAKLREISIASKLRKDYVVLTIDDSGIGVPPAMRLKVFEPFFSGKQSGGKRLGMGLSRAQQILTEHGGAIELLDSPLGGCRVLIELPSAGVTG